MEERFAKEKGLIAHRSITLTQARLYAEEGNFERCKQTLEQPLAFTHPYQPLEILARAAEQNRQLSTAQQLYQQAYLIAPKLNRPSLAKKCWVWALPFPRSNYQNRVMRPMHF
ncbi:MAG: hypothetical protein R2865_13420 [Deinococcales bacterium]